MFDFLYLDIGDVRKLQINTEVGSRPFANALKRVVLAKYRFTICCDSRVNHFLDEVFEPLSSQDFPSARVKDFPLVVHHLIVFEQALTDIEVSLFNFLLCLLDALAYPLVVDWLSLFPAYPGKRLDSPLRRKDSHQVIVEAQEELAGAGVTLSAATASKLIIDSSGLVTFGAEHVQSPDFSYARAEYNICASTCHICCDCYIAPHFAVPAFVLVTGFGNNGCFSFVVLGIEHLVFEAKSFLKSRRKRFVFFHADCAHKNRPAGAANIIYLFNYRVILFTNRLIYCVIHVVSDAGLVGGYYDDFELVNVHKLFRFGGGGAGHSRYLVVEFEEVL
ncbi:hypothetical protein ES703_102060 [subsurface metagenome]